MKRLAVSVEGETEENFVNGVLSPLLRDKGMMVEPVLLKGNVTVSRLGGEMARLLHNRDFVTSLVDLYGFGDKQHAETCTQLEARITTAVRANTRIGYDPNRVVPYVQQYEFEALLFADVSAFSVLPFASDRSVQDLREIRGQFSTPEDIDDSPDTAPSKRIERVVRRYNKPRDGYLVAEEIGMAKIRAECPRFNDWVTRLESWGNAAILA